MKKFSILTTFVTFLALILGNVVVATNSGDACGTTWPVCKGSVFPNFTNYRMIIEYSHRLMVPLLVFLTVINAAGALYKYRKRRSVLILSVLSLVLLVLQSLVGGFNVLLGTPPGFTTFDVTFSQALLLDLVLLTYSLHERQTSFSQMEREKVSMSYKAFMVGYLLYLVQIILGAFFKHSRASNVMMDIPAVEYLVTNENMANMIYSLHWVATVVIFVAALWFVIYASKFGYHVTLAWLYFISIILNAVVGFVIVITGNIILASSIHMIISTITMVIGGSIMGSYWFKQQKNPL
ncbi:COX15/CtaA family protein [Halobacillus rhizosphaerae]|uniref:COX15/CtaA family protein n=1 Tax=Halobacillus rhizosphaerae TaxID=3064889 RepID=UPI00398B14D4